MKNTLKIAAVGVLLAGSLAQIQAQETVTYWVQPLNIALTGFVQGQGTETPTTVTETAQKVRITSKDIIALHGGTTRGQLLIMDPLDFEGDTLVVIRERQGQTTTDTDVSDAFLASTHEGATVENSRTNLRGNTTVTTGTVYSIDDFTHSGEGASFEVQGFTKANIQNGSFNSTVNGTGEVGGDPAVLNGTISAAAGKQETVTLPPAE